MHSRAATVVVGVLSLSALTIVGGSAVRAERSVAAIRQDSPSQGTTSTTLAQMPGPGVADLAAPAPTTTTTTTVRPVTPTTAPAPAPSAVKPAPLPSAPTVKDPPVRSADPGRGDLERRATAALAASVPAAWLAAVPVTVEIIDGPTSWVATGSVLRIAADHVDDSWSQARFIVTHEWAHQLAFGYGTQVGLGASPTGFPYAGAHPEEVWADCVARALTGVSLPTTGSYPRCGATLAAWAGSWLAPGPAGHARTD